MTSVLKWWAYMLIVITVFLLCLLLNFAVKKINEVRLRDKLLRLQKIPPRNCFTQVQEEPVPNEMTFAETKKEAKNVQLAPNATSHVYNKDDNLNKAHGKSNVNPPNESNSASQSKIDVANSKLNFLGAIYMGLLPSKEVGEKPQPMQICDSGSIFKEVMERKAARVYENKPKN